MTTRTTAAKAAADKTAADVTNVVQEATAKVETFVADTQKTVTEQFEKLSKGFEGLTTFGQENVDAIVKSSEIAAKAAEGIGTEISAYSKKAFEDGVAAAQDFASAKTLTELFEKQTSYAQTAFEGFVSQATKMNEIYVAAAKDITAPLGARVSAATEALKSLQRSDRYVDRGRCSSLAARDGESTELTPATSCRRGFFAFTGAARGVPAPLFSNPADRIYWADRAAPVRALDLRMTASDQKSPGGSAGVLTKTRTKTQRPPLYKVMLLNDDYTPMEFVVHVLERFFGINHQQAVEIMLTVHRKGLAVVGVFSFEIAETKVTQVMDYARRNQHPLQCTMEKE